MSYTLEQVRGLLRARIEGAEGLRSLARAWRVSPAYISDVIHERREPGPAILRRLKLVRVTVVTYEPLAAKKAPPPA